MDDTDAVVDLALAQGFDKLSSAKLEEHLDLALKDETHFDLLYGATAGTSRVSRFFEDWEAAIRKELCADQRLKAEYAKWLAGGETAAAVKSMTTTVLAAINPALAVSSVGVLVALWVLRVGANQWCSISPVQH